MEEANLYRIDDQMAGAGRFANIDPERKYLSSAGRLIEQASGQTRQLMTLNEEARNITRTFRALNKLFIAMMKKPIDIQSRDAAMAGLSEIQRKA